MDIRNVNRHEKNLIASILTKAFWDDPVVEYLFPTHEQRTKQLYRMQKAIFDKMYRFDHIYIDTEMHGVAIWLAPNPKKERFFANIAVVLKFIFALKSALARAETLQKVMDTAHIKTPHWYLLSLGTEPEHQGKGVGTALMLPILDKCDKHGTLAYLECTKEHNVSYYQKFGFKVTEELKVPRGPTLWGMQRLPQ